MSYLLHCIHELFCNDAQKRERAIREFREHKAKLVKGFAYILSQAEQFHQHQLKKGGRRLNEFSTLSNKDHVPSNVFKRYF